MRIRKFDFVTKTDFHLVFALFGYFLMICEPSRNKIKVLFKTNGDLKTKIVNDVFSVVF